MMIKGGTRLRGVVDVHRVKTFFLIAAVEAEKRCA
jgi:hypothetical protein